MSNEHAIVPNISLTQAMTDPALFGRTFRAQSFWTWKVVAKVIDGLPLTEPREVELYERCTGRAYQPNRHERRLLAPADPTGGSQGWKRSLLFSACSLARQEPAATSASPCR
jgi:hypothetical protein